MTHFRKLIVSFFLLTNLTSYGQKYTLPALQYAYNSLAPYIDSSTMAIHHSKHHQGYVNNLNKAIAGTTANELSLIDLCLTISKHSESIRNNAGGHFNHSLFWEILTPKKSTLPSTELLTAIEKSFSNIDSLKKEINRAASTRFGSGWAWLIVTADKQLAVCSSPNQDNPLMDISEERGIPILAIDVWEHAYYLSYQNKRGDYLSAIWQVINWEKISDNFHKALKDPLLPKLVVSPSPHK